MARRLGMTQPGVGYAVQRGERIAKENGFLIEKEYIIYLWIVPQYLSQTILKYFSRNIRF